jgi:hypothetical protein
MFLLQGLVMSQVCLGQAVSPGPSVHTKHFLSDSNNPSLTVPTYSRSPERESESMEFIRADIVGDSHGWSLEEGHICPRLPYSSWLLCIGDESSLQQADDSIYCPDGVCIVGRELGEFDCKPNRNR